MYRMPEKILITGAAGFIGFSLCRQLLKENIDIIAIDNFSDYYDPLLKEKRYEILIDESKNRKNSSTFNFEKLDLRHKSDLETFLKSEKPDKICHLAAQAGVRYSLDNPQTYIDNNITATINLLEYSKDNKVTDFILASTSSVYGLSNQVPFSEKTSIDTPISPYATTKRTCELMCHTYYSLYGLKCRILRFFTVYGPWGRPDMALFLFTKAMINNEHIKVFNNGNMQRDFTYIDDIVNGFISAIKSDYPFEIFNLGYGRTVELLDFIKILEFNLNVKAKKIMLPIQPGDVPSTWSDISKAKRMLDYNPQNDVKIGIKNFVDWYLQYYKD